MRCPYCGEEIDSRAVFCSVCGNRIEIQSNPAGNNPPVQQANNQYSGYNNYNNGYNADNYGGYNNYDSYNNEYDNEPEEDEYYEDNGSDKKNKALLGIAIGLGCAVIVLLVVLIVFVVNGKKQTNKPLDSKTTTETTLPVSSNLNPSSSYPSSATPSAPQNPSAVTGSITPGSYMVNTQNDDLNMRAGAGTEQAIVGRIPKGTVVTVTAVNGSWAYVTYNGVSGWVSTQFLVPVTA